MLSRESICCWEKLKMIEKKGQEEAVGFVAIVIIVSIVLLFILGIVLRQESSSSTGSLDVRECLPSGEKVCDLFNKTFSTMIESAWNAGEDSSLKGYIAEIYYQTGSNSSSGNLIARFEKGKCGGGYAADEFIIRDSSSRGSIKTVLKICS